MRRIAIVLSLGLSALAPYVASAEGRVALVLSERSGAYTQVAEVVRRKLNGVAEVSEHLAGELETLPGLRAAVAIGTEACRGLAQSAAQTPFKLCVLLPKIAFERIAEDAGARGKALSAVLLDQPLARQLALVRLAMPERRRIAVLLGPEAISQGSALSASAAAQGLNLRLGHIGSPNELASAMQGVLADADVLLAVPDSMVFNSHTIQNVLRTAFRNRVPLVAFSPAYVTAGALLAMYSTPQQIGRQAGQSLRAALAGRGLPAQQQPQEFEVRLNVHIARSLGIDIDDEATLAERLRQLERAR